MTKKRFILRNVVKSAVASLIGFKNSNLKSIVTLVAVCFASMTIFSSCDPEEILSGDKKIIAFGFTSPPAAGVINEAAKTITVEVPAGTNVTALVPTILVSPLAEVSPATGVAQNFTNPVQYTVTAPNGSTAVYTVTVTKGTGGGTLSGTGSQSDPFIFTGTGGNLTGSITTAGQAVWFKFTANGRYDLTVRDRLYTPESAATLPYTLDVKVSVVDANLNYISDIKNEQMKERDMGGNNYSVATFTDIDGVFYVKVEPYSTGGTGTFFVSLIKTGPITSGANSATAIDITNYNPVPFELELTSSRPVRWFKFTADGRYDLKVCDRHYTPDDVTTSPYTVDVKVSVLNASFGFVNDIKNRQMNAVDMGGNNNAVATFTDITGVFYVKIESYSADNYGSFSITQTKTGPVTGGKDQTDAIPLTIGAPRVKDELTSSRPSRWFKFIAPASGSVALTVYDRYYTPSGLLEEKPDVDVKVSVLDASLNFVKDSGNRLMNGVDIGSNTQSPVNFSLTPGGVYYVKIDAYSANNFGFFYIGVN